MVPRKQAGHMTCTRPQAERQNLLAMRASSTHDPKRTFDLKNLWWTRSVKLGRCSSMSSRVFVAINQSKFYEQTRRRS